MNMWLMFFLMFLTVLGTLIWVGYLASLGNLVAIFVLAVLSVLLIFLFFKGTDILADALRDRAEQKRFESNMQENLANLNTAFTVQNKALTGQQRSRGLDGPGGMEIDQGLFKVLDDGVD